MRMVHQQNIGVDYFLLQTDIGFDGGKKPISERIGMKVKAWEMGHDAGLTVK